MKLVCARFSYLLSRCSALKLFQGNERRYTELVALPPPFSTSVMFSSTERTRSSTWKFWLTVAKFSLSLSLSILIRIYAHVLCLVCPYREREVRLRRMPDRPPPCRPPHGKVLLHRRCHRQRIRSNPSSMVNALFRLTGSFSTNSRKQFRRVCCE